MPKNLVFYIPDAENLWQDFLSKAPKLFTSLPIASVVICSDNHDISAARGHDISAARGHDISAARGHDISAARGHDISAARGHDISAARGWALKQAAYKHHIAILTSHIQSAIDADLDGVEISGNLPMKAENIRVKLGGNKILGVRCQSLHEAYHWAEQGADYIGFDYRKGEIIRDWVAAINVPLVVYDVESAESCQKFLMQGVEFVAPFIDPEADIFTYDNLQAE